MTTTDVATVEELARRVEALERRIAELERGRGSAVHGRSRSSTSGPIDVSSAAWAVPYSAADLALSETWIEIHEHSARPQLQRLIRETVAAEGPVTERLLVERLRVAWGLARAGGRVQEAVAQSIRQLIARSLVEQVGDAYVEPGSARLDVIRVPTDDERSRRSADQVSVLELATGLRLVVETAGSAPVEDVTLVVSKLFGWTRRGGAIQERLELAVDHAVAAGDLRIEDGRLVAVRADRDG